MPINESATGLRIGHLNVYHIINKIPDISLLLNQSSQPTRLFEISETRLDSRIDSISISIPTYFVMRLDSTQPLDIALYTFISLIYVFSRRRTDLESERVECVWVEIMIYNHHLYSGWFSNYTVLAYHNPV